MGYAPQKPDEGNAASGVPLEGDVNGCWSHVDWPAHLLIVMLVPSLSPSASWLADAS